MIESLVDLILLAFRSEDMRVQRCELNARRSYMLIEYLRRAWTMTMCTYVISVLNECAVPNCYFTCEAVELAHLRLEVTRPPIDNFFYRLPTQHGRGWDRHRDGSRAYPIDVNISLTVNYRV